MLFECHSAHTRLLLFTINNHDKIKLVGISGRFIRWLIWVLECAPPLRESSFRLCYRSSYLKQSTSTHPTLFLEEKKKIFQHLPTTFPVAATARLVLAAAIVNFFAFSEFCTVLHNSEK